MDINLMEECPCGTGRMYKRCCLRQKQASSNPFSEKVGASVLPGGAMMDYVSTKLLDRIDEAKEIPEEIRAFFQDTTGTPSQVREQSTEQIIEMLAEMGVNFDKEQFLAKCQTYRNAWTIGVEWQDSLRPDAELMAHQTLGVVATILWERLCPQRPCLEMLADIMDLSYELDQEGQLEIFERGWSAILEHAQPEMRTPFHFDLIFQGLIGVQTWAQYLVGSYMEYGLDEHEPARRGLKVARAFPMLFPDTDSELLAWFGQSEARLMALLGDQDGAEQRLANLLEAHPDFCDLYFCQALLLTVDRRRNKREPDFERAKAGVERVRETTRDAVISIDADETIKEMAEAHAHGFLG